MTVLAIILAISLVAIVHFFLKQIEAQQSAHNGQAQAWREERRELLERIQRPEVVPVQRAEGFEIPEQEFDESHLVGTAVYDPED